MKKNFISNEIDRNKDSSFVWFSTFPKICPVPCIIQGALNQSFPFEMAVNPKLSSFDPMLIKPKCVWEVAVVLKNCKQTAEKWKQIFENWKKLPPLKHILALPT